MSMPLYQLSMYEALTDAGVKPDAARIVERQLEAALQAGHETVRAEMRDQLMTKVDGLAMKDELKSDIGSLRSDLLRAMNEQTWKLVGFVVVANGLMLAVLRMLH